MDFDYDKTGPTSGEDRGYVRTNTQFLNSDQMRSKLFSTQFELGKHWEIREIDVWLLIVLRGYVLR